MTYPHDVLEDPTRTSVFFSAPDAPGQEPAFLSEESVDALLRDYELATEAYDAASQALEEHSGESTETVRALAEAEERAHEAVVLARTRLYFRRCEVEAA